jgi:capsid assembly protease
MNCELVMKAFFGSFWAILPEKYEAIRAVLRLRASGGAVSKEEIQAIMAARPQKETSGGAIAILPLFGTITQRADMMTEYSGGTSTESYARSFRSVMSDPGVKAVVMQVDSPGGSVYGVPELADQIFESRGQKPIIAAVDSLAASAAYWIASAADEIVVTPSGEVGSIGVFAEHLDYSKFLECEGVKPSLISAGKYKIEGNQYEPLGDEARAAIQKRVDEYYDMFTAAVAKNRGTRVSTVREGYGEGRVVGAQEAVSMKMADRIGTIGDAVKRADKLSSRSKTNALANLELEKLSL